MRRGRLVHPEVSESDWKLFREVRELALQRFCERVLGDVVRIAHDSSRTDHERYLEIFSLMKDRDEQLAHAFDRPARSRMLDQLAPVKVLDLLVPSELGRFSDETRNRIELMIGAR